ncbi:NUDIX domain-containing protein [Streptomyces profundus]|uniref:NUDIX domain-containing protein n=1 Tax=Streptomyces profundus TaxID=2867410 RepID=UPI001D164825|nr:NUDIX domain-containing protein [Streptomyces sp. MA3_2.13]UED86565.1 hypothetical protein K4G22_22200 [Streptomyces sp. MA3_2.13]
MSENVELTIRFELLTTTADNQVLLVRNAEDVWELPGGVVAPGACLVAAARELGVRRLGYFGSFEYALAVSLETGVDGRVTGVAYVLDGGRTETVPTEPGGLREGAEWRPLRGLLESGPLVQHALLALAQGERVPVLTNGETTHAGWPLAGGR